ncbi:hypothetical protein PV390_14210 [Streptomyces sp. ME02-6991-2A]|uniref:hypothetical protein n=1 Tax=Streptomyces TaxID=1883 RepID=UPI0010085166|nr:hypothetical protein [Streptomyces sp. ME02-6991-2A]MDX3375552.1 hypothetical protein [Streptomyces sp. ME02-6991-2A]
MLILLGAAGGALRGLLDAYNRFLDWQSDRRAYRRLPPGQENVPARFQDYFDPVADPIAAVVHSAMGAGAAVLFGTTGQVSGAYAAIVVGISAPVILTQLGRVQSISDAVNGAPQAGTVAEEDPAEASPQVAPPAQQPAPAGSGSPPPDPQPSTAGPTQPSTAVHAASARIDERRQLGVPLPDVPSPRLATGPQPDNGAYEPQPNGRPVDPTGGPCDAIDDHEALHHPHGPAIGEEGTAR